jgi:hypothetical protein
VKLRSRLTLKLRLLANLGPILLSHILIDLNRNVADVQTILTVAAWAGDPIFLSRLHVAVVRLETGTLEAMK